MMTVALCLAGRHDPRLVFIALIICAVGSWTAISVLDRVKTASGNGWSGWIALAAVVTGSMAWATHFVAMMAYVAEAPVVLDPALTVASLLIAIATVVPGFALVTSTRFWGPAVGGGIVGLGVAGMHYAGLVAYRVDGMVQWDWPLVAASILLSVSLAAASMQVFRGGRGWSSRGLAAMLLGSAIAALHVTGMAAMTVIPLVTTEQTGMSQIAMASLAVATAVAGLLVIGCAAMSVVIDTRTHGETLHHLRKLATLDTLTGLPNRLSFDGELSRLLTDPTRTGGFAVVMIDLSGFKAVNDTYGHQAGDQLLIALGARFRDVLQPGREFLARLGGDEFALLLPSAETADASLRLRRIAGVFKDRFEFYHFSTHAGASIGVAMAPGDGQDSDTLLANADLAMYRAKQAHSPLPYFYNRSMDQAVRERRDLAMRLRATMGTDAFHLVYQVQCDSRTLEVTGYEALCRWQDADGRHVAPSEFIPLAEEIGEAVRLGTWILTQACRAATLWPQPYSIGVNLSPLQFADTSLIATVCRILLETGLCPCRLELEMTEAAILSDRAHAVKQLAGLKELGATLVLDDFGTGNSSLDLLGNLPFDRIKFDTSFTADVVDNPRAIAMLGAVASLGRKLDRSLLAEGIETMEQLELMSREGCGTVQGYLLGRPGRQLVDLDAFRQTMQSTLSRRQTDVPEAALIPQTDVKSRQLLPTS